MEEQPRSGVIKWRTCKKFQKLKYIKRRIVSKLISHSMGSTMGLIKDSAGEIILAS